MELSEAMKAMGWAENIPMGPAPTTEGERDLLSFLHAVARVAGERPTVEVMLLTEGRWFPAPPAARPADVPKMMDKHCFWNARTLVLRRRKRTFTYCEGYALSDIGFPCHHAWVVDDATGLVVDPTWREPGRAYMGVTISDRAAIRQMNEPMLWARMMAQVDARRAEARAQAEREDWGQP